MQHYKRSKHSHTNDSSFYTKRHPAHQEHITPREEDPSGGIYDSVSCQKKIWHEEPGIKPTTFHKVDSLLHIVSYSRHDVPFSLGPLWISSVAGSWLLPPNNRGDIRAAAFRLFLCVLWQAPLWTEEMLWSTSDTLVVFISEVTFFIDWFLIQVLWGHFSCVS